MKIGLLGLLGSIFVALKLAQAGIVASWSWWWVLLPFYIVPAILIFIFMSISILAVFGYIAGYRKK